MLIVMLYDTLLFVAVVLGLAFGHFLILRTNRSERNKKKRELLGDKEEKAALLASVQLKPQVVSASGHVFSLDDSSDDDAEGPVASPCCANNA